MQGVSEKSSAARTTKKLPTHHALQTMRKEPKTCTEARQPRPLDDEMSALLSFGVLRLVVSSVIVA